MPSLLVAPCLAPARARYHGPMVPTEASVDGAQPPSPGEATRILRAAAVGEEGSAERLLQLVCGELHALADRAMAGERPDHTLQPTALVHEAWVKLFDREELEYNDHRHFLAVAAQAMRQILVDHAKGRRRAKRGGSWQRVALEAADEPSRSGAGFDLVALDGALEELERKAPRQARVVELRYFGGLSVEDTARALDVSERTVAREWRFARAWLSKRLRQP